MSQLEVDLAGWNSLEAEIMVQQGLTAGCSAVGGMELWEEWNYGRDGIMGDQGLTADCSAVGGMKLWEEWSYGRPRVDCRL